VKGEIVFKLAGFISGRGTYLVSVEYLVGSSSGQTSAHLVGCSAGQAAIKSVVPLQPLPPDPPTHLERVEAEGVHGKMRSGTSASQSQISTEDGKTHPMGNGYFRIQRSTFVDARLLCQLSKILESHISLDSIEDQNSFIPAKRLYGSHHEWRSHLPISLVPANCNMEGHQFPFNKSLNVPPVYLVSSSLLIYIEELDILPMEYTLSRSLRA